MNNNTESEIFNELFSTIPEQFTPIDVKEDESLLSIKQEIAEFAIYMLKLYRETKDEEYMQAAERLLEIARDF